MKSSKEQVLDYIKNSTENKKGFSALDIATALDMQRSNASSILNELHRQGVLLKIKGKPVIYGFETF